MDYFDNARGWYLDSADWLAIWLSSHEVGMTRFALWMLCLGFGAYAIEKGITWWDIRAGVDQTDAGKALKLQKLVEAIAWSLMSGVFGFALLVSYGLVDENIWARTINRIAAAFSVWWAVVVGMMFLRAFKRSVVILSSKADFRQVREESFLSGNHVDQPASPLANEIVFGSLTTAMPIVVADQFGKIRYTTAPFNALVGADMVGHDLIEIMPERYRARHLAGLHRFLTTGESRIIFSETDDGSVVAVDLLRQDGSEIPVHLVLTATKVDSITWFMGAIWARSAEVPIG